MFTLFSITQSELENVREFCRAYLALKQMALNLGSRNGNGYLWTTNYGETLFQYIPKIITEDEPQPWGAHRVKTLKKFSVSKVDKEITLRFTDGRAQVFPLVYKENIEERDTLSYWDGSTYAKQIARIIERFYPHQESDLILRTTGYEGLPIPFGNRPEEWECDCGTNKCGTYACSMIFAYKFLSPQRYAILIEGDIGRVITAVLRKINAVVPNDDCWVEWIGYDAVDNFISEAIRGE